MRRVAFFLILAMAMVCAAGASGLTMQSLDPITVQPVEIAPLDAAEITLEPQALVPAGSGSAPPGSASISLDAPLTTKRHG